MNFIPNLILNNVTEIDKTILNQHNIKGLILDVDNTLACHGKQDISQGVLDWIATMKKQGIRLIIVSNNTKERISPLAKELRLNYIAMGFKPLNNGFKRAKRHFKLQSEQIAVIGDQIYTDVLGGNLMGMYTILVTPISLDETILVKVKRSFEKVHINNYYKRLDKNNES